MAKIFAHRVHFTANLQRFWRNPPWSPSRSTNAIRGGLPRAMTIRPRPDRAAARGIFPWLSAAGGTSSGATPPPRRPPLSTMLPVSWSPTFGHPPHPLPKTGPQKIGGAPRHFVTPPKRSPPQRRQPHAPPSPATSRTPPFGNFTLPSPAPYRGAACATCAIAGSAEITDGAVLRAVAA